MGSASAEFAIALENLVVSLQSGEPGYRLTDLLAHAWRLLSHEVLVLTAEESELIGNGEPLPSGVATRLHDILRSNGVYRVALSPDTTARELLQFAALLFSPISGEAMSFADLWQARGTWGVRIDPITSSYCTGAAADDTSLVHDDLATEDDEVQRAVAAVGRGASWAPGTEAGDTLARADAEAARTLLAALARTENAVERRRYFDAMLGLRAGVPELMRALDGPSWFVARNAALLLGDMAVRESDLPLARLMTHADCRVRVAAVSALGKLDTPLAREAIDRSLADPAPRVRAGIWRLLAQRQQPPSWVLTADALRAERDDDVLRSVIACLERHPHPQGAPLLVRLCARLISDGRESGAIFDALELLTDLRPRAVPPLLRPLLDSPRPLARARAEMIRQRGLEQNAQLVDGEAA